MCAIGLTDSSSRYVIINEFKETDPLTLSHSYWPALFPPSVSFMPFHNLIHSDRVHPELVNKSLSRTTTATSGVTCRDDLLSLALYFAVFHHRFPGKVIISGRHEMFPHLTNACPLWPSQSLSKPDYYLTAPLSSPHCVCQGTDQHKNMSKPLWMV